ncbi:MAG: hypothetical protein ACOYEP_11525 [Limnochordia bacterium]|jgi:hypothetical protein
MTAFGWSSFPPQSARGGSQPISIADSGPRRISGAGRRPPCPRRKAQTFQGELEDLEGTLVTLRTVSGRTVGGRIEEVFQDYLMFVSGGVEEAIPIDQITNVRVCPRENHRTDAVMVE